MVLGEVAEGGVELGAELVEAVLKLGKAVGHSGDDRMGAGPIAKSLSVRGGEDCGAEASTLRGCAE